MLYEIFRRKIYISKIEDQTLRWNNNTLTVRTEKGLQFYEFALNLQCIEKEINLVCSVLHSPKNSPAAGIIPTGNQLKCMTNLEMTEMMLDPGYWPHNPQMFEDLVNISHFEWSPMGTNSDNRILAVLNNIGNVNLFIYRKPQWKSVLNLSMEIRNGNEDLKENTCVKDFQKLQSMVKQLESSFILWGPECTDSSCYFITSQRNGEVLFWLIQNELTAVKANLKCQFQTDIGEIVAMLYIPTQNNNFLLICTNLKGQIYIIKCVIQSNTVECIETMCLWSYMDKMITKHLQYVVIDNKIILFCNKHRHLLVQMLDLEGNVVAHCVNNVNDHRITDVVKSDNQIYMTTANCKIYKVTVSFSNEDIAATFSLVETKDQYPTNELYSLSITNNGILWTLAMSYTEIKCRKRSLTLDVIFLCADLQHNLELPLLLKNPSRKLTDYWDCVEVLRYKAMKLKSLPSTDFDQLYSDGATDIYKLKLYYILVIIDNSLSSILKNESKGLLPETSIELVRENIYVSYACKLITELYSIGKSNDLSPFELETYVATKKFLEYVCNKNSRSIYELMSPEVYNFRKLDHTYVCQCCDENIENLSCKSGHINMFCSLTFTLIDSDDYLACKGCSTIARPELYRNKPACLICDVPLSLIMTN